MWICSPCAYIFVYLESAVDFDSFRSHCKWHLWNSLFHSIQCNWVETYFNWQRLVRNLDEILWLAFQVVGKNSIETVYFIRNSLLLYNFAVSMDYDEQRHLWVNRKTAAFWSIVSDLEIWTQPLSVNYACCPNMCSSCIFGVHKTIFLGMGQSSLTSN